MFPSHDRADSTQSSAMLSLLVTQQEQIHRLCSEGTQTSEFYMRHIGEDLCIVGFPKCGTVSLEKFLQAKGHHTTRAELAWTDTGVAYFEKHYSQYRPVFITRNPADRIWSGYHYFNLYQSYTFKEILSGKISTKYDDMGMRDPIEQSDYATYIKPWEKLDPIILSMEEMADVEGFGKENITPPRHFEKRGLERKMPAELRKLVDDMVAERNFEPVKTRILSI